LVFDPVIWVSLTATVIFRSPDEARTSLSLRTGENVYPEELETHYSKSPFIKEICILGLSEDGAGGVLHAIVVPEMDEFRRRGQTAITEMIRFDIENLRSRFLRTTASTL
jgi:long-subunit acyl-CoA synthetase (AMP-forming)